MASTSEQLRTLRAHYGDNEKVHEALFEWRDSFRSKNGFWPLISDAVDALYRKVTKQAAP